MERAPYEVTTIVLQPLHGYPTQPNSVFKPWVSLQVGIKECFNNLH
jgi:hypothetical protein